MLSNEIRSKFLEFFHSKGHRIVKSDALVPSNDPTLLFTSAGMVQFKDNFLGRSPDPMTRATSCQKCFRTTDIDNVGYTARHQTFFEMLGNFSFGDYFKREAVQFGWEFVTEVLKLDPDRLYPTVFESDDEAFAIWEKEIGVDANRIRRLGRKDNFWGPVGGAGPCGPCSEILYDQGAHIQDEEDRYLEIWNLVFVQFDAQLDGSYPELDRKSIDTGAGLERIAAVMQGVDNNFETDLFHPYIQHLQELTGLNYKENHAVTCAMRVIADHIRATTFAITDQVVPSNMGRGYVLRRIMRRAMLHGQRIGLNQGFFAGMVPVVVQAMQSIYPELVPSQEYVQKVVVAEEQSFHRTLARGSSILEEMITSMKADQRHRLTGEEAFRLYDTYGFPFELTMEILTENGLDCSRDEFEQELEQQRQRARAAWKGSGMKALADAAGIEKLPATDFLGYRKMESAAQVVALFQDNQPVDCLAEGASGLVVLDQTPFYPESGGQVCDQGELFASEGMVFEVFNTQKSAGGVILHEGSLKEGTIRVNQKVTAQVDIPRRKRVMPHHTATHLLQAALRKVLGDHVLQQGSFVGPDNLRFDFTHTQAMTRDEIAQVERSVNHWVQEDYPVVTEETTLDEARKRGAMALFGEKYGEQVRLIEIGPVSCELCGGTHVDRTGRIGPMVLLSEESIQAGVRRVTALTGEPAVQEIQKRNQTLQDMSNLLNCPLDQLTERLQKLQDQLRERDKEIRTLKEKGVGFSLDDLLSQAEEMELAGAPAKVLKATVEAADAKSLEAVADRLKQALGRSVILLAAPLEDKVALVCSVSKELTDHARAGDLVRIASEQLGGKGGGRPDWAKGGGKDSSRIDAAMAAFEKALKA